MFLRFGLRDLLRPDPNLSPKRFRESRVGRLLSDIRGIGGEHGAGALEVSFAGGSGPTSPCLRSTCSYQPCTS